MLVDKSMISVYSLRSGVYYDGYYYAFNDKGAFLRIDENDLSAYTTIGTANIDTYNDQITALAMDYAAGTLYGLTLHQYLRVQHRSGSSVPCVACDG